MPTSAFDPKRTFLEHGGRSHRSGGCPTSRRSCRHAAPYAFTRLIHGIVPTKWRAFQLVRDRKARRLGETTNRRRVRVSAQQARFRGVTSYRGWRLRRNLAMGADVALGQAPQSPVAPPSTVTMPPRDFGPGGAPTTYFWDPDVIAVDPTFNSLAQPNAPIQRLWTGALWSVGAGVERPRPISGLERYTQQPTVAVP